MPLVLLGIIVVVGACLMIYYQIGPSVRVSARKRDDSSPSTHQDKENPFGGYIDLEPDSDYVVEPDDHDEIRSYGKSADGKVLYIFDAGKTEIRPLDEEDEVDEKGEEDEEE